jgi:hypothetical protein
MRLSRWCVANHDMQSKVGTARCVIMVQCSGHNVVEQGLKGWNRSSNMSENVRFEIPKEMRSMAEANFEQARKTFEKFLDSAKETAGTMAERNETMRAGAKDISAKAIGYAETNVQASLDYAERLLHAKDLPRGDAVARRVRAGADARARRAGQ